MIGIANIMLDVTDKCNFRCAHCYKKQDAVGIDLPLDLIEQFLDDVEANGKCNSIVISGGEPLLYSEIEALLNRLNGKYHIRVNTNGYYVDKYIDFLKTIKNLKVQISMDGYDDNTFYQIRKNHGFIKIIQNGIEAKKNNIDVYYRATLTSKTLNNYEEFIRLSEKIGIPFIIRPIVNTGEERQQNLCIDYSRLLDWYKEIEEKDYLVYTAGHSPLTENSCPLMKDNPSISILTIDNMGDIYPCSLLRGNKFLMGNLKYDSLDSLGKSINDVILNLKNIVFSDSCHKCGFRETLGDGTCAVSCYFGNKKCIKKKIYED